MTTGPLRRRLGGDAELLRRLPQNLRRVATGGDVEGVIPRRGIGIAQPLHGATGLEESVDHREAVVDGVAQQETGRPLLRLGRWHRLDGTVRDALEGAVESFQDPVEFHAHLKSEGPAAAIAAIRRSRHRAARRILHRVVLRLEGVEHLRPVRLVGLHHPRAGGITASVDREGGGGPVHHHAGFEQGVDQPRHAGEIRLVGGQDETTRVAVGRVLKDGVELLHPGAGACPERLHAAARGRGNLANQAGIKRPVIAPAALNGIPAHAVDVVEQFVAMADGVVQHRIIERDRIIDGLAEMPRLGRNRIGENETGHQPLRRQRDAHGSRVPGHLGEDANLVVVIGTVAQAAISPSVVGRPGSAGVTGLVLEVQARDHGGTQRIEARYEHRVVEHVERVAIRRPRHHRSRRAGLVVVVDDLGDPIDVEDAGQVAGLPHVHHEEVPVVIVTDVFVVEPRDVEIQALQRIRVPHIPRAHEFLPVRVIDRKQDHDVVEDAERFRVGARREHPERLDQLLRADGLGGVQPAVNPHDRFAGLREGARLLVRQILGPRQLLGVEPVALDVLEVLRGGADQHVLRATLLGEADLDQLQPIRLRGQPLEVSLGLGVGRQVAIVTDVEAEMLPGRSDRRQGDRHQDREEEKREAAEGIHNRIRTYGSLRRSRCVRRTARHAPRNRSRSNPRSGEARDRSDWSRRVLAWCFSARPRAPTRSYSPPMS